MTAFLPPWAANKWGPGGCPAFPRMLVQFPEDETNLSAREGQAAFHYITETIRGRPVADYAPNKHPITDEMRECGEEMLADMRALITTPGVEWCVEQELRMPQIHQTHNWGRVDFGAVDRVNRVVHSWEYKFGHSDVDAFENWQVVDYSVGLVNLFKPELAAGWAFDFRVYQPRSFHGSGPMKQWTVGLTTWNEVVGRLATAAAEAAQPDAPFRTGPHCDNCPAAHACPALLEVGGAAIDRSRRGIPHVMEPRAAGMVLREVRAARERLEDLETGLEAQLKSELKAGKAVPGWELVQGYGRERWTQPVAEVVAMGSVFGFDLSKPAEAITPAQARKKGFDEAVISEYSEKPLGEVKLKPIDAKAARKAFQ